MEETPWGRARLRRALAAARAKDLRFRSGEVLGSMCTAPHPDATWAYQAFMETNLGDPGHFPGTARLEEEVLVDLARLTNAPKRGQAKMTSGGTEANLLAAYIAREHTGGTQILVPDSGHFSFEKAARLLGMDLVFVPTDKQGLANQRATQRLMSDDTALIVGIAGTTELGLVDPIPALARLAKKHGAMLHVDAAFGGYVLPFLEHAPPWDFRVQGVTSISLDPHKGGMAPVPAGALVLRDGRIWDEVAVESPYVSTERQSTLLGTRPGAAAAATWAVHRRLGRQGYREVVARCMAVTQTLAEGLKAKGIELVAEPVLNLVTFRANDAEALARRLAAARIGVNVVPRHEAIRVVVNPHVTNAAVKRLLAELP